jgi:Metallo-peptidase family M12B Reprolysin-like
MCVGPFIRDFNQKGNKIMKLRKLHVISMLALGIWGGQSLAISLSPNKIGGGDIPGSYPDVQFSLGDGNWARNLKLPQKADNGATISIKNGATYGTSVAMGNTDFPVTTLSLATGESSAFAFDAAAGRWVVSLKDGSPKQIGAKMPDQKTKLARYIVSADDWAPVVTLPGSAPNGAVILIQSTADQGSKISADGVLYAATLTLTKGDVYAFSYSGSEKKWQLIKSPVQQVGLRDLVGGVMPAMAKPVAAFTIPAGVSMPVISLPASAGDRDRIRLMSKSSEVATVSNGGVDFTGTMKISADEVYEFVWIAEMSKWTIKSSPVRTVQVGVLSAGQLPDASSPRMIATAADGNWAPIIKLPLVAKPGDRVTVQSQAQFGFSVSAEAGALQAKPEGITFDDQKSFVFKPDGTWSVETINITMLNVYSDGVVAQLGEQAARARQVESVRLTNEALENSGANFRVKMVGLIRHSNQGAALHDANTKLRTDPIVQGQRKLLKANAIYYEGTESGCGLAWMNANPSAFNMVATGSTACGTAVMRHEFGHNMGLRHGGDRGGSAPYAKGYSRVASIMGGNAIPYYSTPKRYDPATGIPLGIVDQVDAVRAMNDRSAATSKFSQ